MTQNLDAELTEKSLGNGSDRDARRSLPRTCALKDIAGILKVILDGPCEIGVPGARTSHRLLLILAALDRFYRKDLVPVLPILVPDDHRNGRTDGRRMPDTGYDLGLIRLDLHPPATAEPLLATP